MDLVYYAVNLTPLVNAQFCFMPISMTQIPTLVVPEDFGTLNSDHVVTAKLQV